MKITTRQFIHSDHPVTCRNCQNHFVGKICNKCGEKVFDEKQLSAKHFFHQIIDFFTHFENKVLKTLWLNIARPGLVTKHNLEGIRVRYANPIQLYLVVSVLFFFTVTKLHVYDYTPTYGDQNYYGLSAYRIFRWAEPADIAVLNGVDRMQVKHFTETKKNILANFDRVKDTLTGLYPVRVQTIPDTTYLNRRQLEAVVGNESEKLFFSSFNTSISAYSKTFIFVMLPLMAALLFLFFFRSLRWYGSALVLATHFMVFNLCFFIFHCIVDWLPAELWGHEYGQIMSRPLNLFFSGSTAPFANFLFGSSFVLLNLLFWVPWLAIAFRRLFNKAWWINIITAFIAGKVFYYLIFGLFKKLLIAFTLWTMH